MEPTSAKKIISLQLENANYSRENGLLKDSYFKLELENKNLKLEISKLKEQLQSLQLETPKQQEVEVSDTQVEQELSKKDALDLLNKAKKGNKNGL